MSEESRLGREAIETAYALKQLVQAGVRVFFYLEDRERTLDSPTDKIMLSLTAFADELEREKARQRTYDAMLRKARAGHVTGGACLATEHRDQRCGWPALACRARHRRDRGRDRPADLPTVGRGPRLQGNRQALNDERALSPRAQQGRSQSWAPSSVRAVLFRPLYRGEIVWSQTQKRDTWGRKHQTDRPESDWIRRSAPALRIVSEAEWDAAHARLTAARAIYLHTNKGRGFGRPALGNVSKYLLTNLALCGCCGGSLKARSRSHGTGRKHYYGCSGYHDRGRTVCTNQADVPMGDADDIVIEALLDDILDPSMVRDAVDVALEILQRDDSPDRLARLDADLQTLNQERARLAAAIATGGDLGALLDALRTRDELRRRLEAERATVAAQTPLRAADASRMRSEVLALASSWRQVLVAGATHARPIVTALLKGRVSIAPHETKRHHWILRGEGSLRGLFERVILPLGVASPSGTVLNYQPVFRGEWRDLRRAA